MAPWRPVMLLVPGRHWVSLPVCSKNDGGRWCEPLFLGAGVDSDGYPGGGQESLLVDVVTLPPGQVKDPGAIDQKTKQFQQVREAYDELQKFLGADDVFEESGSEGKTDLILTLLSLTVFSSLKWALFLK